MDKVEAIVWVITLVACITGYVLLATTNKGCYCPPPAATSSSKN